MGRVVCVTDAGSNGRRARAPLWVTAKAVTSKPGRGSLVISASVNAPIPVRVPASDVTSTATRIRSGAFGETPDHVAEFGGTWRNRHTGRLLELPAPDLQLLEPEDTETDGGGEGIADGFRKIL